MADDEPGPLPVHGQICYLQIPADDVAHCGAFYDAVFGWQTEVAATGFTAPGMIGQWITDRAPAPDAGPVAWVCVDEIDDALAQAKAHGGTVVDEPTQDGGSRWLATLRDPAGNLVGVVQLGPR
jgi:predicted enzyme related to lactoylglutathione lyase